MTRSYLGKVFLSHSTPDKKFVRLLNARLRSSGYETWLDEHELVAGDPLGSKIADGVRAARVILVIVSRASVESKWLKYELNLATERMVKGECRVIPVVIDDSNLPAEVLGLLYADFRGEFKYGYKSIRTTLQHENTRAEAEARFWIVARRLIRVAFGGSGGVWMSRGYTEQSYDIVHIPTPDQGTDENMNVFFEIIPNHAEIPEPLNDEWWRDFSVSMNNIPERLFLIVTERPIAFDTIRPDKVFKATSYREFRKGRSKPYAFAVCRLQRASARAMVAMSRPEPQYADGIVPMCVRAEARNCGPPLVGEFDRVDGRARNKLSPRGLRLSSA